MKSLLNSFMTGALSYRNQSIDLLQKTASFMKELIEIYWFDHTCLKYMNFVNKVF